VAQIRQAEQDLETLHKRQEQVRGDAAQAARATSPNDAPDLERLKKEQRAARDQAEQIGRRLKRLEIQRSEESLRRAASRMTQAEQDLEGNARDQAAKNSQAALEDVEQAQRETARARREAEEQLAREALEKMADVLQGLIVRQQAVIDETTRLDAERAQRGNWSRGQLKSLANLAETERGLKAETGRLAEKVQEAAVFELVLRQAAEEMERAAERLSRRLTDAPTVEAERQARKRLVDLVASLATEPRDPSQRDPSEQPQEPEQAEEPGAPADPVSLVAQLKLLKAMQEDLRQRTASFDQSRVREKDLTEEQRQQLLRLAEEQRQLADLADELARAVLGAHGDDPGNRGKSDKGH